MAPQPERFLIWGAGGHGKVIADLIRATGATIVGFIDRDRQKMGCPAEPGGSRVVLLEEQVPHDYLPGGPLPLQATAIALGIGDNAGRARCRLLLNPDHLPPIVSPDARISPWAKLGAGVVALEGVIVHASASVGAGSILNTRAVVEHDCVVGEDVHVSPGAVLCGGVHIGSGSWIGAGAIVIPRVRIGRNCVVGAGAVVIRDVPDAVTVVGNPARRIESTKLYETHHA